MVGKWYVVDYIESGKKEYVNSLEELAALVGLTVASTKTYLSRGLSASPRQVIHPDTKTVELAAFHAVDMAEPLPESLKELITARA